MTYIPEGYKPRLSIYDTQRAIDYIKRTFQMNLAIELNLRRVSAPLFVTEESGLNDNLNGVTKYITDTEENVAVYQSFQNLALVLS